MRVRLRRRFAVIVRLAVLALLALSLLMRPVLSAVGEVHELAHDPAGRHLDVGRAIVGMHDAACERGEGKGGGTLHAFLHIDHCSGQASVGPPDGIACLPHPRPETTLADLAVARAPPTHRSTPFRPPIAT